MVEIKKLQIWWMVLIDLSTDTVQGKFSEFDDRNYKNWYKKIKENGKKKKTTLSQNRERTMGLCYMVRYMYKWNPRTGWGGHKTTTTTTTRAKFEEMMADNFPKLMTDTKPKIQFNPNQRIPEW